MLTRPTPSPYELLTTAAPELSDVQGFTVAVADRPAILSASISSNRIALTWTAIPSQAYHLQYKLALQDSDWVELTDVLATGSTASAADSLTSDAGPVPQRLYRILVVE
jgi:hypothetical protein